MLELNWMRGGWKRNCWIMELIKEHYTLIYRDLPHYALPEHRNQKGHQPTPPELIPELAELGVTRDSTYVPGMERPEVDVEKF